MAERRRRLIPGLMIFSRTQVRNDDAKARSDVFSFSSLGEEAALELSSDATLEFFFCFSDSPAFFRLFLRVCPSGRRSGANQDPSVMEIASSDGMMSSGPEYTEDSGLTLFLSPSFFGGRDVVSCWFFEFSAVDVGFSSFGLSGAITHESPRTNPSRALTRFADMLVFGL